MTECMALVNEAKNTLTSAQILEKLALASSDTPSLMDIKMLPVWLKAYFCTEGLYCMPCRLSSVVLVVFSEEDSGVDISVVGIKTQIFQ